MKMLSRMQKDFKVILGEVGRNLTLRRVSIGDESGPIWGEGTVSYTEGTVLGFIDSYDIGKELLGMGDIGVGMTRAFLENSTTPSVNDLLIDGSKTYKIQKVDTFQYSSGDVYVVCDISVESG